jgi:hypothetical protein
MTSPQLSDEAIHRSADKQESSSEGNWRQPKVEEDVSEGKKDTISYQDLPIDLSQDSSAVNEKLKKLRHTMSPRQSSKVPVVSPKNNPFMPTDLQATNYRDSTYQVFAQSLPAVIERRRCTFVGTPGAGVTFDGVKFSDNPEIIGVSQPPPKENSTTRSRGILKRPTESFPEDPSPVREGVAPLKDAKKRGIPRDARWTKISRKLVNPEALDAGKERYEAREDFVIVLRPLSKEEIVQYSEVTEKIRGMFDQISLVCSSDKQNANTYQPEEKKTRGGYGQNASSWKVHGGSISSEGGKEHNYSIPSLWN